MQLLPVFIFVWMMSFSLQGVSQEFKQDFTKIKTGLNELQVKALVGSPTRVEAFKTIKSAAVDTCTYWFYESNGWTLVFKNHELNTVEKDRNALLLRIQQWAAPHNKDSIRIIYGK